MEQLNPFQGTRIEEKPLLNKRQKRQIEWIVIGLLVLVSALCSMAQTTGLNDLNYQATSEFVPTIKDAIKFSDLPEIKDSVRKINNIKYGISSSPIFARYETQVIESAKLQNEPLPRLYNAILKIGYAPIYNMPLAEFRMANTRSKETAYGASFKHFSSTTHLKDAGYGGFSDNMAGIYGKRFYKKHTLNGDLNYERRVLHYYGYDTTINTLENDFTKQRYQLIAPKLALTSHYSDSTHINHTVQLGYYNLQNLHRESENNVRLNVLGDMFINKEKFKLGFLTDYYNNKQANDSFNNMIVSINPSFEANGKKWHADMGVTGTLDNLKEVARFYFYPQLNLHYDIYENLVIPYVGTSGALIKNSFRSLSTENPFIDTTVNDYQNTNNKYNIYGGLRGNLSSSTSYDAKLNYAQFDNLHFFVVNYGGPNQIYNQFDVLYDQASVLTISGELKYQLREKYNVTAKGNYYVYNTKTLVRAYHRPDYDLTLSGIYNLQSKFIIRADLFFYGQQWALSPSAAGGTMDLQPKQIAGWADLNLEGEYRYSKMLSFFARFNNLANQRYYRWERYPSQRFNFMVGLSFVPF